MLVEVLPQVVDLLCQLKEDSPELSIPSLLKTARAKHADIVTDEVSGGDDSVYLALTTTSSKGLVLASRETGLHAPRLVVER